MKSANSLKIVESGVDALKRLQAETPVNKNTGRAADELDALLPALLDRAFKGKM